VNALLAVAISGQRAGAEEPGTAVKPPGLTLAGGALSLSTTAELEMSADAVAKPWSIAPDLAYGVTDDVTIVFAHSTVATTGFRGAAGSGVCLAGDDAGCPRPYRNGGLEGQVGLLRGPAAAAAVGGLHGAFGTDASGDDVNLVSLKLGARTRVARGPLIALFNPSVFIALDQRDQSGDAIWLPLGAGYRVSPPVTVGLGTGINGPIDGFSDGFRVPIGIWTTLAPTPRTSAGASFTFGRIAGGSALSGTDQTGPDFRALHLWFGYTL
jgi:hypothetical protein